MLSNLLAAAHDTATPAQRAVSLVGLFAMLALAWLMSSHKRQFPWRVVLGGVGLQFCFALLILNPAGEQVFKWIGQCFQAVIDCTDAGSAFLFDIYPRDASEPLPAQYTLWRSFAFGVLPTIIFFSSLMAILYHWGIMQRIVALIAWVMRRTLGTSGAETLSTAANIFVGQTEAPLVVRPYVARMTLSELNVVMVGGFATIAGGVLAIFIRMGIDPGHLLTASVISAPAALAVAKIMQPETEDAETDSPTHALAVEPPTEHSSTNVLEAAAEGATTGMKLAINVAAMLIAFVGLVALVDLALGGVGGWFGYRGEAAWSLTAALGYLFAPLAWLMGIPWSECLTAGGLLGTKMVVNEVLSFAQLTKIAAQGQLSPRSVTILTFAMCGFANLASIGVQLGGIGAIAPERRGDLARLAFRAMLGGTLAAYMTACIAGILL